MIDFSYKWLETGLGWIFAILYVDRKAFTRKRDFVMAIIKSCLLGAVMLALALKLVWFLHKGIVLYCTPQAFYRPGIGVEVHAGPMRQIFASLYQFPIVKYFVFVPIVVAICGYFYLLFLANKVLKLIFVIEVLAYYKIIEQVVKILRANTGCELLDAFFGHARRMLGF